jgi:predicted phosphodiesterase
MMIQYFSDLHLEFRKRLPGFIPRLAPVLILAGDIGTISSIYSDFLQKVSNDFDKVFLILGNHEHYDCSHPVASVQNILSEKNLSNISLLDNSYEDYKQYRFVGSTLWSHITNKKHVHSDFFKIPDLTVEKYNQWHQEARAFVEGALQTDKKIVMITHHLPSHSLTHPAYARYEKYQQCYSSACDDLIRPPIVCWFFGHTHKPILQTMNGIPMCCNPIGYPGENLTENFSALIDI